MRSSSFTLAGRSAKRPNGFTYVLIVNRIACVFGKRDRVSLSILVQSCSPAFSIVMGSSDCQRVFKLIPWFTWPMSNSPSGWNLSGLSAICIAIFIFITWLNKSIHNDCLCTASFSKGECLCQYRHYNQIQGSRVLECTLLLTNICSQEIPGLFNTPDCFARFATRAQANDWKGGQSVDSNVWEAIKYCSIRKEIYALYIWKSHLDPKRGIFLRDSQIWVADSNQGICLKYVWSDVGV